MRTPLRRRRSRLFVTALSSLLMLLLASQSTLAAVSWTSAVKTSYEYGFNYGQGLARTTAGTTTYLHTQYLYLNTATVGIYYRRGNASGTTWGTHKRVNASDETADYGSIAAAGANVYVAYNVINDWDEYDPGADRAVKVRVNTDRGASTAWLDSKSLGAGTRLGKPSIAATGAYAWLVYTDSDTGVITVANNAGVNNNDAGWLAQDIGTTTHPAYLDGGGYDGYPVVAATGATILVAWIDNADGTIKAKISTDNGVTWPDDATTITDTDAWDLSAAALSGRLGLAWTQPAGVKAKVYVGTAWGSTRTVATFSSTGTYKSGYGTAIALEGSSRVGVAWATCTRLDCSAGSTKGVNVRWRESTNNLSSWKDADTIASYTYGTSRRVNDSPSVVMTSSPARIVTYNTWSSTQSAYKLVTEVGRGNP
jgi:hypothetical protein